MSLNQLVIKHLEGLTEYVGDFGEFNKRTLRLRAKKDYVEKWTMSEGMGVFNLALIFILILSGIVYLQGTLAPGLFIKAVICASFLSFWIFPVAFNNQICKAFNTPLVKLAFFVYIEGLFFLNSYLEGKADRDLEVKLFHEANNPQDEPKVKLSSFGLKEEYLADKKEFCQKYFKMKSNNFLQFYEDRVLNANQGVNTDYLYFSLLVPQRDKLSTDALRRCLQNYPQGSGLDDLVYSKLKDKTDAMFQGYTPEQVERLFTNYQGIENFSDLEEYVNRTLPVAKNFIELLDLLEEKKLTPELERINRKSIDGWLVKVLKSKREYNEASNVFKNCVKGYIKYSNQYIITFYKQDMPEVCVSVGNKRITQISGVSNQNTIYQEEITLLLKEKGIIE